MQREMGRRGRAMAAGVVFAAICGVGAARGATIFSDNFSSSSLNPGTYPSVTSSSTGYDVASTKNATSSISGGAFTMGLAATKSGVIEAQALFTNTPVTLGNVGDFLELQLTFNNTNILNGTPSAGEAPTTSSTLDFGLYNSGGSAPVSGLQSSGLGTGAAQTADASGGAQLWQGYLAQLFYSGGNSRVVTRPAQTGGTNNTNAHQDLIGNGAGGGLYNDPTGAQVGSTTASALSLSNSTYTGDVKITLTAVGTLSIETNLYSGAGTGGTNLASSTVTATGSTLLTSTFDGLAFGWRETGASVGAATTLAATSLTVTSNVGAAAPGAASMLQPAGTSGTTLGTAAVTGSAGSYQLANVATNAASGAINVTGLPDAPVQVLLDVADNAQVADLVAALNSIAAANGFTVSTSDPALAAYQGVANYDVLLSFASNPGSGGAFQFAYDFSSAGSGGAPITIANVGVVPEPASVGLIGMVVAAGLTRRRRRGA